MAVGKRSTPQRLATIAFAAGAVLRWSQEEAFVLSGSSPSSKSFLARPRPERASTVARRVSMYDLPGAPKYEDTKDLEPDMNGVVNDFEMPMLPPELDGFVAIILKIWPVLVMGSWIWITYKAWDAAQQDRIRDEKRKIRRAIKVDEKLQARLEKEEAEARLIQQGMKIKKKKKKTTVLEEVDLAEKAREKKKEEEEVIQGPYF
eukprot:TRINITY_DN118223_c0_g1_i1.p1 TRINITY_DN118223_c0_g1~~TRINITY_DN118223_c0_g1_i1.p1  ORF type:complete len:240 (+),score=58.93 TRINITY_DN118223_c0_g1_i1:110-721(+)